jgi:hypothetical protein
MYLELQKKFSADFRQIGASAYELRTTLETSQR